MNKIFKWILALYLPIVLGSTLLMQTLSAEEEKKPKYTWEYHLITWMPPNVERYDNVFPFTRESRCRTFLERIALVLDGAQEEAPGFGWVGICSPVQKS